ncbi:carbamoyltransferase [Epidermidibacterium keratini]|uniref:Carbamoyltransferase n=1 Tax=Epidermidibacterium keratini TaxID=1891644 RepID=A0A7L4YM83_9ACTN|nr:carbamoyltransferase [Epidermidibacterium keratini]
MRVLGVNALFHDPAAALIVDGEIVAAAEEERFSRRKHGKRPVPFSAWELPELSMRWCLEYAGLRPADLDAVAYSFDPGLSQDAADLGLDDPWDHLRLTYARRAPEFLASSLPGLDRDLVRFVPHHLAHAASAAGALAGNGDYDVLVLDGRGERASHLSGVSSRGVIDVVASQELPHSLGLLYEDATEHLGFLRSSDEYKVMALASYGKPRHLRTLQKSVYAVPPGFRTDPVDWSALAPRRDPGDAIGPEHADLAASLQLCVEEVLLALATDLNERTGNDTLALAGGVALNCVANTRIYDESPYRNVVVQPAAGDAGTALGAATVLAVGGGDLVVPMTGADLGRGWDEAELEATLREAGVRWDRPADVAEEAAGVLADNGLVAWFEGRSEYGPRALGHRSLLAHPGNIGNLERLNAVKGREQFRPVAPMVLQERASDIFQRGPLPSPYMLFVHDVAPRWQDRIPAVVHADQTARVQTIDAASEPVVARLLHAFEKRTRLPVLVNTSLNTAGRPMVDSPRDALECFGSSPVDLLVIGPYVLRRDRR